MSQEKKSGMNIDPQFLEALRKMKENLPAMTEWVLLQAHLHKKKYDALIEEGFTEIQALELCKNIFQS